LKNPFAGQYVALKGNHEALLEIFLDNPAVATQWWRLGGLETLRSFDISVRRWMTNGILIAPLRNCAQRCLPSTWNFSPH
jgi:hypothetical protein